MIRGYGLLLITFFALFLPLSGAVGASINVGGFCLLDDAIESANTDTAVGGCTSGSGADVISLASNGSYSSASYFVVSSEIVIEGNLSTIDGRWFVQNGGSLLINEATLTSGVLVSGSDFTLNRSTVNFSSSVD